MSYLEALVTLLAVMLLAAVGFGVAFLCVYALLELLT